MSNYGENPYYGNGGGGFVQGSPSGSQDSPGGTKKTKSQTIRPVTVKQLHEAEQIHQDSEHTIDGHEIGQILLVGAVRNETKTATNVSYEVGDGTGYIDVRMWLDTSDDEAGKMEGINQANDVVNSIEHDERKAYNRQDHWISIMGSIKVFGGKKHVSATHIRPITDHNEIYNHLLKAVYVSLSLRNPGGGNAGGRPAARGDYSAGATTTGAVDTSNYSHLPPIQRAIMEAVANEPSDDGMHVSAISRATGEKNGQAVMDAIEYLMQEGMLYSTIDDLHVKAM